MKIKLIIFILFSLLLTSAGGFMEKKGAEAAIPEVSITSPTGSTAVPETLDFATENYADPWDMSSISDLADDGVHYSGVNSLAVSGGKLSGTTSNVDPAIFMVHPATFESIPMGRDGLLKPISTTDYNKFSFRMYASESTWVQLYWFYNQTWTSLGVENKFISSGWNTYTMDLSTNPAWTGTPIGLRFDPSNESGVSFEVDWMKLRKTGTNSNKVSVQWTDSAPGKSTGIWIDDDSNPGEGDEVLKQTVTSGASNSVDTDVQELIGGTYYVYLKQNTSYTTPVSFSVNQPSLPQINDPDVSGGADYATVASGDPWDMSQLTDVVDTLNVSGLSTDGSVISGTTTSDDPNVYLRIPNFINTDEYRKLSFRFKYDGSFDLSDGTMTRFLWNNYGRNVPTYQTSQDIVTNPGWATYNLDLETAELDAGSLGWSGNVNVFRFDPLETVTNRKFYLDNVKLAKYDEPTNGVFPIKWQDNKTSPRPTTVSLYYDTDNSGYNGTLIASGISQQVGENTYNWNTSGLSTGKYYIYMVSDDGVSTNRTYSTGEVKVVNSYDYNIVSAVNPPANMAPGRTAFAQVHLLNTGGSTWYSEANSNNPMRLAVLNEDGKSFWPNNDTWVGNDRIAMTTPVVPPGSIGTFAFTMKGPSTAGIHTMRFMPVVEGVQALRDVGMQFTANVNYNYNFLTAENPPATMTAGSTASVKVHLVNSAGSSWYNEANSGTPMRLAILNEDGKTFFPNNDTWVGNDRIALTSPSVLAGSVGTFSFTIKAPNTPGVHTMRFMPVVEGVQALRDVGMQFIVTVQ